MYRKQETNFGLDFFYLGRRPNLNKALARLDIKLKFWIFMFNNIRMKSMPCRHLLIGIKHTFPCHRSKLEFEILAISPKRCFAPNLTLNGQTINMKILESDTLDFIPFMEMGYLMFDC